MLFKTVKCDIFLLNISKIYFYSIVYLQKHSKKFSLILLVIFLILKKKPPQTFLKFIKRLNNLSKSDVTALFLLGLKANLHM